MAVELDIAGNFAAGQKATLDRRRARQYERMNDYELAEMDDKLRGKRSGVNRERTAGGLDELEFAPLETNGDPLFQKIVGWWKQRRANRVMPSRMMPEQMESIGDEMGQLGMEDYGGPAQTFPLEGGGAIPTEPLYRDGGAIPRYADGGGVASEEEMIRRRAAANRARAPARVTNATQRAIPRTPPRPGLTARAGSAVRGAANAVGRKIAPIALGATAVETARTPTEDYRKRFGMETNDPSLAGDIGARALGAASDLGNVLTLGAAGKYFRDKQGDNVVQAQPAQPETPAAIPKTPDEAIAQQAIAEGTKMAEKATAAAAPPGDIDFSKVDFEAGDIPNMPVRDWVEYRAGMVSDLMLQGATAPEAHAKVTQMQQQGFVNYAQQSLMHLQAGNANAAATALRAAYQYFPNGTDVQLGVQQGKDGQPVIVGQGRDEETGEPKGPPMVLNSERLAVLIENFSNPDAFRTWTKDWRDEQFNRQKYEEVEKPEAESNARYRDRAGRAALINAEADRVRAGTSATSGRRQADLDRANAAFQDAVEMLGYTDQAGADRMMSLMAQIYARSNWQYPQVIEFVRKAQDEDRLDEVMQALGLGE